MTGYLRKDCGDWWIEYRYRLHDRPISVGTRWRVTGARTTGALAPEVCNGLVLTHTEQGRWQAYKDGAYLVLDTEQVGEQLPEEEVLKPGVRKGVDVRYHNGRWEKYLKRDGWVAA